MESRQQAFVLCTCGIRWETVTRRLETTQRTVHWSKKQQGNMSGNQSSDKLEGRWFWRTGFSATEVEKYSLNPNTLKSGYSVSNSSLFGAAVCNWPACLHLSCCIKHDEHNYEHKYLYCALTWPDMKKSLHFKCIQTCDFVVFIFSRTALLK